MTHCKLLTSQKQALRLETAAVTVKPCELHFMETQKTNYIFWLDSNIFGLCFGANLTLLIMTNLLLLETF